MQIEPVIFRLQKTLRQSLRPAGSYLLAVSGGADSLALAHACAALQREGWGSYQVCHVEHGLRGEEALHDMRVVQQFCKQQGLPCSVQHVAVRELAAAEQLSLEAAARRLRYDALRCVAKEIGADAIVTAHNLGDQAETVLLRLVRGAGLDGLAGMRLQNGDILRPLLGTSRQELEAYCKAGGISYCHDSTNDDMQYTRNRVRLDLLPKLAAEYNPDIVQSLARTASLLAREADFIAEIAGEMYAALAWEQPGSISLAVPSLLTLHEAVRLRVLRLAYFKLSRVELDYERTLALEALCVRRSGGKLIQLPGAVSAVYKNKQLIFTKQ